jgi:hypothetical protein
MGALSVKIPWWVPEYAGSRNDIGHMTILADLHNMIATRKLGSVGNGSVGTT